MKSPRTAIVYALVLVAGGIAAIAPMPYKLLGLFLIAVAFILPLLFLFDSQKTANKQNPAHRGQDLLMPALAQSAHIMTGGTMSSYYIDLDTLLTNHRQAGHICERMARLIRDIEAYTSIDRLVFIERDAGPVGAVSLLGALTSETEYDALIVRTKRLVRNSTIKPYQKLDPGLSVILVTDVVTGGGHLRHAVQALRACVDQRVFHVACYACREPETIEKLKHQGIIIHALYWPQEVNITLDTYAQQSA
jgi:orotate phosphoribosyltransferase